MAVGQVIETWAFSLPPTPAFPRYMSVTHTRSTLQKVHIDGADLQCLDPESKAGDFIALKPEQECVVIMSACPMDLSVCNEDEPSSAKFDVSSAGMFSFWFFQLSQCRHSRLGRKLVRLSRQQRPIHNVMQSRE
ncbi:uncharacterized protein BO66DRAFT_393461 [Aspergillus aculeatinus CBS 121060]|uniref:Uncharacterized protein n=1 Tax=Aspergillus aculeatinus CBS 121060 TaxID=1448322 RepID=A0ACD1H3C4_9EURO|nr:hypothetical protein BO66DRAFT_393461 [Aspergillus aculeatinus CBS 121060]RAH68020.1 hypothetical protein BO66DRAFT_393461 [Aspergillus aculeatinus CBS 121060]